MRLCHKFSIGISVIFTLISLFTIDAEAKKRTGDYIKSDECSHCYEIIGIKPFVGGSRRIFKSSLKLYAAENVPPKATAKIDRYHATIVNFRDSILESIKQKFGKNFSNIEIAKNEPKNGLALIVDSAEFSEHLVKYSVVLMDNGKEVHTFTQTAFPTGSLDRLIWGSKKTYIQKILIPLSKRSIETMAAQIYDATILDKELNAKKFWDKFE